MSQVLFVMLLCNIQDIASSLSFEQVVAAHCLAALNLGAGVEQSFDCLIVQNRQAVQSTRRSMDWTLEDNIVDGLFFCATLTGRRGCRTPFVQAGVETSDTGAEAVKPDPGSSWEGHYEGTGAGVGNENAESREVVQPFHLALVIRPLRRTYCMMLLSDELMSCAVGTNGCLDLRRRASALGGWVSAEWSRCPGSMARRARDSVAPLRRSSAGWMPARIGRLAAGVGRRHPVTICKVSLMAGLMRRHHTGAQYSAVEWTRARVAIRKVSAPAPKAKPESRLKSAMRDVSFLRSDSRRR